MFTLKQNLKITVAAVAIALASVSGTSLAAKAAEHEKMQPVATTVAEILQDNQDDRRVSLRGTITKQESKETFLFEDGSGEMQLDIDSDLTDKSPINPPVEVEIIGEIDKGIISDTQVDVKSYKLMP